MRTFLVFALQLAAIGFTLVVLAFPAGAVDASSCFVISDADARTFCLARARRDAGRCYAIQRPDMRTQCLAEVRK